MRVDLFDVEIESLRLVLDVHAALARRGRPRWRSRPPPSSPPSTASWPRSPRWRKPTSARTSPSCCRSTASARSRPRPRRARRSSSPPRRTSARRSPTTGRTSARPSTTRTPTTSTCGPDDVTRCARRARSRVAVDHSADQPVRSCAPSPPTRRRARCGEAEPELEKLVRSGYRTVVAGRAAARASAPPTTSAA